MLAQERSKLRSAEIQSALLISFIAHLSILIPMGLWQYLAHSSQGIQECRILAQTDLLEDDCAESMLLCEFQNEAVSMPELGVVETLELTVPLQDPGYEILQIFSQDELGPSALVETAKAVEFETRTIPRKVQFVADSTQKDSRRTESFRFGNVGLTGARLTGFDQGRDLQVRFADLDSQGSHVLRNWNNLSMVGGILMVSTATPDSSIARKPTSINYDPTRPDGQRVQMLIGKTPVAVSLFDWELKPLVAFVESNNHGVVSIHMHERYERIVLERSFQSTMLGLRLTQGDLWIRGVCHSQKHLPRDANGILLERGESELLLPEGKVEAAQNLLAPLLSRIEKSTSRSVLLDANVPYVFSIESDQLVISGLPYYFFASPAEDGIGVIPDRSLNDAVEDAWPLLRQLNPVVMNSIEKSFRTVALLRFQKAAAPDNWNVFINQTRSIPMAEVRTPTLLCKE